MAAIGDAPAFCGDPRRLAACRPAAGAIGLVDLHEALDLLDRGRSPGVAIRLHHHRVEHHRPLPHLEPRRQVSAEGQTPNDVLAGWEPARFVDGLPILPRFRLDISDEDLVFNSYLNLPQVIYCHNRDLKAGLHVLDDAARRVNRTGQYRWVTPAEIAATNYVSWRRDTDLIVRTPKQIERGLKDDDWFLREIIEKGKVLYEAPNGPVSALRQYASGTRASSQRV